jgi:hypothetical protein
MSLTPRMSRLALLQALAMFCLLLTYATAAQAHQAHGGHSGRPAPDPAVLQANAAADDLGPAPEAKLDVAQVRGIEPLRPAGKSRAGKGARAAARVRPPRRRGGKNRARTANSQRIDMRILLLSATGQEPTFHHWQAALRAQGVPFDAIVAVDAEPITTETLQRSTSHGRYQGIVVSTGALVHEAEPGVYRSALSADEWSALQSYEGAFGVREIVAYAWPNPAYGLDYPTHAGDQAGQTLRLTAAGTSAFRELAGPVPVLDPMTYGYRARALDAAPLVEASDGSAVVSTSLRSDGVEQLVSTLDANQWSLHGRLLVNGMLSWLTQGTYVGLSRNHLGVDVDDVFLANDRWSPTTKELDPDPSTAIRMTAKDVDRAVSWQRASGIRLNMLFNGAGAGAQKGKNPDGLTVRVLNQKDQFRWTNHTFTHLNLDDADAPTLDAQIRNNVDFARKNKITIARDELVTGEHSGLGNPLLPAALGSNAIRWIGADASRPPASATIGPARVVPRHPTGVFYNVGTRAEQLAAYNWVYTTPEDGGSCTAGPGCLDDPVDWNGYLANESRMILRHVLGNDPRPHYVHQSNLAEDGVLYPVLDAALQRYRTLIDATRSPLVQVGTGDAGAALARQRAWEDALASGAVTATRTASGVTLTTSRSVEVPLSGTAVGTVYGGLRSGWRTLAAGETLTVGL